MSLAGNRSLARNLSQPVVTGFLSPISSESIINRDRGQGCHDFDDQDVLDDMYIENTIHSGEKMHMDKAKKRKKNNVRANLGFFSLMLHDFKYWYKRWTKKNWEIPFLRHKIKTIETNFGSGIGSLFVFTRWVLCLNMTLTFLWLSMVVIPTAVTFNYDDISKHFAVKNLFDGQGVLAQSWLFYGNYKEKIGDSYHLAVAYLMLILLSYFGSLGTIARSIAVGRSSQSKTSSSVESRLKFSLLLFTSWDHSISSDEASTNLSKGIASMFKDNLYEAKATATVESRSRKEKYTVIARRSFCWFITIMLVGGGCAAITSLVIYVNLSTVIETGSDERSDLISIFGTPIIFSLINMIVPLCITKLPKLENYAIGGTELKITLARVFILRMANLIALLVSLYSNLISMKTGCSGTIIGQEFYKLVMMDTIVHACFKLLMSFGKFYWTRNKAEFDISSSVLVLVYRQGLVWVGMIACPVLPLIGALSNLVFFYVNYLIVKATCKPPIKRWNQSRNTAFFSTFLLITLLIIIVPISVIVGSNDVIELGQTGREDQVHCGPFGSTRPTDAYRRFAAQQASWITTALGWVTSDAFVIPVFLILISVIIYQTTKNQGEEQHRIVLQAELQQERKDNQALMRKVQKYDAWQT